MSKIDVSQWKEFKVGDLFEPVLTNGDNKQSELPDGNIPLISATADNNGVVGYYESDTTVFPANSITVDMFGHAFVQPKAFQTVAHGRVNVLLTDNLSFNTGCFVSSIIERVALLHEFGFKTMLNQHKLKNLKIKLPITSDGKPNWEYMGNYIAELAARAHRDVSSLNQIKPKPHKINIDSWQKFKIGDVFEKLTTKSYVHHQLRSDLATSKSTEFSLPLVYAKHDNNGIMYYDKPSNHESYGHCLSVIYNGAVSAGLVFPQLSPVGVWAEAYLLRCKYDINDACLFYLATVLQRVTYYKYNRDNLAVWSKVKYDYIFLPVTSSGQPDFDYMTKYIKLMQSSAKCRLQSYQSVGK